MNESQHIDRFERSLAQPPERCITEQAAAAAEGPLIGLVTQVTSTLHAGSPEQLHHGAVKLQMLGSTFEVIDAAIKDRQAKNVQSMSDVLKRWADTSYSSQQYTNLEPLFAAQSTLLALAAPPDVELRFLTALAARARGAARTTV